MKDRYKVSKCDDGQWMVHDDGDIICYAAQGSEQQKAQYVADALNVYSHQFKNIQYKG
jgi:hypothetical protein